MEEHARDPRDARARSAETPILDRLPVDRGEPIGSPGECVMSGPSSIVESRPSAWLLLGPTGSGKSPLGHALAEHSGRYHLDFGQNLRSIAAGRGAIDLDVEQTAFISRLLEAGALFPDSAFPLAARIVRALIDRYAAARGVILNGIPRSVGQASEIESLLAIERVIVLDCPEPVVAQRVSQRRRGDSEDHAHRSDDRPEDIRRKLHVYCAQTRPLVEWYRRRGTPIATLPVEATTTAEELLARPELRAPK